MIAVWLRHQREAMGRAARRFVTAPLASLLSVIVIGVTLALPVGLYLMLSNLEQVASHVNAEPEISVFLKLDTTTGEADDLAAAIRAVPGVASLRFVSKEDALKDMQSAGGLADVLTGLDKNPFPHAYIVRAGNSAPENLEAIRAAVAALPKVDSASHDSDWAKRLASFNAAAQKIVLMLAAALGVALLAVTANTIRLQIMMQRDEIELGRLIGATNGYIRRPYLYFGAFQGLAGGLIAVGLAIAGLNWLAENAAEVLKNYAPNFIATGFLWEEAAAIAGAAALLGWLGAYASVQLSLGQLKA